MNKKQIIICAVFSIAIFIAYTLTDYYHIRPSLSFMLGGIVGVFWKTLVTISEGAKP